jgi:hypothetical protein
VDDPLLPDPGHGVDMTRLRALPVVLAAAALVGGTAACTSSSSSSSKPAVCTSVDQLKSSMTKLTQLDLGAGALDTLRTDLAAVKKNLQTVSTDAKSQYSADVSQIRAAAAALQTQANAAKSNPGVATLGALATAVKSLSSSVTKLADDVASTCK